jgi:hypothetical protein
MQPFYTTKEPTLGFPKRDWIALRHLPAIDSHMKQLKKESDLSRGWNTRKQFVRHKVAEIGRNDGSATPL